MNMFRLWRLFHRSGTRGTSGRTSALAIVAFASATAVFLTVLGGLHGFIWRASADHTFGCMIDSNKCAPGTYETWSKALANADKLVATVGDGHWTADQATAVMNTYSDGYVMLAAFASLLLIVPFVALAGSAAVSRPPAGTHVSPHCDLRAPPPRRSRNSPCSMRVARLCLARWSAWPATSR